LCRAVCDILAAINLEGDRMTRSLSKPANRTRKHPVASREAPKTLRGLNATLRANYGALMKTARKNCIALTGKPTFGGASRRKSA
jgi:hypothetical protein